MEIYVDSYRMKSLNQTPYGKARGGLAAPVESKVYFRSDIFAHHGLDLHDTFYKKEAFYSCVHSFREIHEHFTALS